MSMRILLFDGQGSLPLPTSAVQQPRTPLATLFLRETRTAFAARIASLAPGSRDALNDRATRALLGKISDGSISLQSSDPSLLRHPLIAFPSLYVTQVVRLLEELEMNGPVTEDGSVEVIGYSSGILPALLVATSFPSPKSETPSLSVASQIVILRHALALFAVATSIGIETQISKEAMFTEAGITLDDPSREREWSAVTLGETRGTLEAKLTSWNSQKKDLLHVHLTAQTTARSHTISGLPSSLSGFLSDCSAPSLTYSDLASQPSSLSPSPSPSNDSETAVHSSAIRDYSAICPPTSLVLPCPSSSGRHTTLSLPSNFTAHATQMNSFSSASFASKPLSIYTLFHSDTTQLRFARGQVLSKFFPLEQNPLGSAGSAEEEEIVTTLSSLRLVEGFTLHDVRTGCVVPTTLRGRGLVELLADSIFLHRIEFPSTLATIARRACQTTNTVVTNYGPGSGLARAAMRELKRSIPGSVTLSDASVSPFITNPPMGTPTSAKCFSQEPIAIVGMAVNFPGAHDASELWRVLEQGLNTVEEIPETRFSISPYIDASPKANPGRHLRTRFGNFLPDGLHAGFDNTFFRISPREARTLDPQMRVLMRVGLQAVEAAGLVVQEFAANNEDLGEGMVRSEDVGCYVGVATNDYVHNLRNDIGVHYATSTLPAFLAGRLAYSLRLSGPSIVVDTACSSSLVAIHQACRSLLAGDCKAALAGGVNVISSPDMYLGLDRAHFLSPTGNCKPWDANADGYCRSEGSGMFVLKRLSDALACSDNVLGVIRGTEVNQSSAAVSITRPHGQTQAALFRNLLGKADLHPEEVSVVEAHGTGTQAGDPEELRALRDVLSPNAGSERDSLSMLTVTSLKGNIGHAEAASGAASLAKVLLMLRHRAIPTQVGLAALNPKIDPLDKDFTRINTSGACIEWTPGSTGRRIALINNFGAAGSNATMLLEEAPLNTSRSSRVDYTKGPEDHILLGLSAETEDALLRLRDSYIASIAGSSLVDFGYTATARRKPRPWRIAVSANTSEGIARALSDAPPTCTDSSLIPRKKIVFVFSGQGSQYPGMARQLYTISSSFRDLVDYCHEKLVDWGYPGVLTLILAEHNRAVPGGDDVVAFQCAMFVLEYALYRMWESWGVVPDAVAGHSLGEYAALVASGVLSVDTGLRLVARRALLMSRGCERNASGMLAVRQPAQRVSEVIKGLDNNEGLSIACYNGPHDVVVGGPHPQLDALKTRLELSGVKCASVNVPFAYHTAAMEPILVELTIFARKFDFSAPSIPIVSNVTGRVVQPGDGSVFDSEYFAKHCRQAVRFDQGACALVDSLQAISAFIEIGPHPTTLPLLAHLASASGAMSLHSLHRKLTDRTSLCSALSRLFVTQDNITWSKVYRDLYPSATCLEIPGYPLRETEFWVPFIEDTSRGSTTTAVDPLERFYFLNSWTQKPSSKDANISEFETPIVQLAEYITGHKVAASPLCPASVYYELALSAATCTLKHVHGDFSDALTLSEVQFTLPLVYDPVNPVTILTSINLHPNGGKHVGTFTISSVSDGRERVVHCTGFFQRRLKDTLASKLSLHKGTLDRGKSALLNPENGANRETLRARTIYELIFSRVVQYSKLYQVIDTMTLGERNGEGFATFHLTPEQTRKGFVAQPVFIDALLHVAGFLINSRATGNDAFICNQVDASKVLVDMDRSATFEVYCTTAPAGEGVMVADAWAVQTGESRRVVAHMKRMRFSRVRLSNLSRHLSRFEDYPSRNSTPAPFLRSSYDRCTSPMYPAKLGSPFRPAFRVATPSSVIPSTDSQTTLNVESEIIDLVADLCGIQASDITLESAVADLGIDSLVWIELLGRLRTELPQIPVDISELMKSTTVGELASRVIKVHHRCSFEVESPKSRMPFTKPDTLTPAQSGISMRHPRKELTTSHYVKEILGRVLEMSPRDLLDDASLDSLGLDSLGSIEALTQLQDQFEIILPYDFFNDFPTVSLVQAAVAEAINQRSHSRQSSSSTLVEPEPLQKFVGPERMLTQLQTSVDDASPVFLVHDGSGLSHCYSRIGDLDRTLWGISNPKLLNGESWKGGVPEMAAHYLDQIKPMVTDTGCVLGGWSFGGVVAFHMACELIQAGVKVAGVVLIDSPSPFTQKPLPDALIDSVICPPTHGYTKQQSRLVQLARTQMTHATKSLVAYEPFQPPSTGCASQYPDIVMLRCSDAFSLHDLRQEASLEPMPFLEDRGDPKASVGDWEKLTGKDIRVLDIPGHHFEPFSPKNVPILTQQLRRALSYLSATD